MTSVFEVYEDWDYDGHISRGFFSTRELAEAVAAEVRREKYILGKRNWLYEVRYHLRHGRSKDLDREVENYNRHKNCVESCDKWICHRVQNKEIKERMPYLHLLWEQEDRCTGNPIVVRERVLDERI